MHPFTRLLLMTAAMLPLAAAPAPAGQPVIKLVPLGSYREETAPGSGICRGPRADRRLRFPLAPVVRHQLADNALDILDLRQPGAPDAGQAGARVRPHRQRQFRAAGGGGRLRAGGTRRRGDRPGQRRMARCSCSIRTASCCARSRSAPGRSASPSARTASSSWWPSRASRTTANAIDPKGGIAIIDLGHGIQQAKVRFADFSGFNSRALVARGVRIGPDPSDPDKLEPAALDLEPHSITVSPDSRTAFVVAAAEQRAGGRRPPRPPRSPPCCRSGSRTTTAPATGSMPAATTAR